MGELKGEEGGGRGDSSYFMVFFVFVSYDLIFDVWNDI